MQNITKLKDNYKKFLNENFNNKINETNGKNLDVYDVFSIINNNPKVKKSMFGYKLNTEILEKSIEKIYVELVNDEMGEDVYFDITYTDGVDEGLKKNINDFFEDKISDYAIHYFLEENRKNKKSRINEGSKWVRWDMDDVYNIIDKDEVKRALVNYKLSEEILENSIKEINFEDTSDPETNYIGIDFDITFREGVDEGLKKRITKFFDDVILNYIPDDFFYDEGPDDLYENRMKKKSKLKENKKRNIFKNV